VSHIIIVYFFVSWPAAAQITGSCGARCEWRMRIACLLACCLYVGVVYVCAIRLGGMTALCAKTTRSAMLCVLCSCSLLRILCCKRPAVVVDV
jgi:hypothetical protein